YNLLAIEFLAAVACFFVVAWRSHRDDFWLLGGVLLVAIVLVGAELALQNDLLPLPKIHLIHFVMPLVFAVIGARLIQLFVGALQQAEALNAQLEQRVAQKSEEIERSWEQVARLRTEQAAQDERRRIASDLHDDLGAQLLTIAQASQRGVDASRVAGMARVAMEEMRLSVRGLTGSATLTDDVLADWRSETITRLAEAGMEGAWEAQEPPPGTILPARLHVQLTRILREAVSNVIRHSGGGRCTVRVAFPPGELVLEVEDDGRGLPAAGERPQGHGLLNIERRARNLGGGHRFAGGAAGGTRLVVRVPLAATLSSQEQP
ncbi:MAG: histidine kinase, partial [Comamonadaceae bacterium]